MAEINMVASRSELVVSSAKNFLPVFAIRKPQDSFYVNKGAVEVYEAFWGKHFKSRYKLNRVMFASEVLLVATIPNPDSDPLWDILRDERIWGSSFVSAEQGIAFERLFDQFELKGRAVSEVSNNDLNDFFSILNVFAVGFLNICTDPNHSQGVTYENVMRRPDVNYAGIGSSLMNAANSLAREYSFAEARLTCTAEKPLLSGGSDLQSFYKKWGFREEV